MVELTLFSEEVPEQEEVFQWTIDDLAREGARRLIQSALEVEVEEYVNRLRGERDEKGHAQVVRNGHARARRVQVGCGEVEIRAPRVNDRRVNEQGERQRFRSSILPPYVRRSPNITNVLPVLYLRGLSTGDFSEALESLLGKDARGLSATSIVRLKKHWQAEYEAWRRRDLSGTQYAYIWVDGVYFHVRLEEEHLACLVVIGVREDGKKEVLALEDGYRESEESWLAVLRDLKDRGMNTPLLAIGDGALGFWKALKKVGWNTRQQRCWVHKIANVLDKLPKRLQPRAKSQLHAMMNAESRTAAEEELARFKRDFGLKYPKTVACLEKDWEELTTLYDFPAEHWLHIRTTNAIESTFATVKHRMRTTRGAGSRDAALTMAFKLSQQAEKNWRSVNAPHRVAELLTGKKFVDGEPVPNPSSDVQNQPAVAA